MNDVVVRKKNICVEMDADVSMGLLNLQYLGNSGLIWLSWSGSAVYLRIYPVGD